MQCSGIVPKEMWLVHDQCNWNQNLIKMLSLCVQGNLQTAWPVGFHLRVVKISSAGEQRNPATKLWLKFCKHRGCKGNSYLATFHSHCGFAPLVKSSLPKQNACTWNLARSSPSNFLLFFFIFCLLLETFNSHVIMCQCTICQYVFFFNSTIKVKS